jgi:hypothetical protein
MAKRRKLAGEEYGMALRPPASEVILQDDDFHYSGIPEDGRYGSLSKGALEGGKGYAV